MTHPTRLKPYTFMNKQIKPYTVFICDDCIALKGEMCHQPACVFCRRTMEEVGEYLDVLLIRPIIDGKRIEEVLR